MTDNIWNQQNSHENGHNSSGNNGNGRPRTGNLLSGYREQQQQPEQPQQQRLGSVSIFSYFNVAYAGTTRIFAFATKPSGSGTHSLFTIPANSSTTADATTKPTTGAATAGANASAWAAASKATALGHKHHANGTPLVWQSCRRTTCGSKPAGTLSPTNGTATTIASSTIHDQSDGNARAPFA